MRSAACGLLARGTSPLRCTVSALASPESGLGGETLSLRRADLGCGDFVGKEGLYQAGGQSAWRDCSQTRKSRTPPDGSRGAMARISSW